MLLKFHGRSHGLRRQSVPVLIPQMNISESHSSLLLGDLFETGILKGGHKEKYIRKTTRYSQNINEILLK